MILTAWLPVSKNYLLASPFPFFPSFSVRSLKCGKLTDIKILGWILRVYFLPQNNLMKDSSLLFLHCILYFHPHWSNCTLHCGKQSGLFVGTYQKFLQLQYVLQMSLPEIIARDKHFTFSLPISPFGLLLCTLHYISGLTLPISNTPFSSNTPLSLYSHWKTSLSVLPILSSH